MEVWYMLSDTGSHRSSPPTLIICMFSTPVRGLWFLLLVCTLASELVPLSRSFEAHFSTLVFHGYEALKLVCFLVFGFLAPIAWWRYNNLGMGVLFAIVTTVVVELGQAFIPGHRASALELAVKLILLFAGFAAALDVRKYQEFHTGPLWIRFSSPYWSRGLGL
jgi:hypothetical protein